MNRELKEARSEAEAILQLPKDQLAMLFYRKTMRRTLSRTVRQLDKLVLAGGEDRKLGRTARKRLSFDCDD
jgi:hypothetical protein